MVLCLPFLMKIHQEADDSLLNDSMIDECEELHEQVVEHLDFSGIQALWSLWSIRFMPITIRPTLLRKISNHPGFFGWQSDQVIQNTYKVTSRF